MKFFEALDIPRFARPNLIKLDPYLTAQELKDRLSGNGFMSYEPLWPKMSEVTKRQVTDFEIGVWWKSAILISAMTLLRDEYDRAGIWYGFKRTPRSILGLMFKPSVRGVLFANGKAEAHLINPRKGQRLTEECIAFLKRAAYEEHCISDPNNPQPVVVDTSSSSDRKPRRFRASRSDEMVSVDEFERIVNLFFEAAAIAGFPITYHEGDFTADLFRRVP